MQETLQNRMYESAKAQINALMEKADEAKRDGNEALASQLIEQARIIYRNNLTLWM